MLLPEPTPERLKMARELAGLTQTKIAEIAGLKAWQRWQEYEAGKHKMDPARWELLLLRLDQHPTMRLVKRK